ncbi:MAG: OmpA family protein [Sediminispirochaetaceae bacterium]
MNDRYSGLQYRQRRLYLEESDVQADAEENIYEGSVYLIKEMSRNAVKVSQPIDTSISIRCVLDSGGIRSLGGGPLPVRSSFPVLIKEDLNIGDRWTAGGRDSIYSPEMQSIETPFECTYEYRGESSVMDKPAQVIAFTYTYKDSNPYTADPVEVRGRGDGEIALFLDEDEGFFIKERLVRHFINSRKQVERREEGFRLTWGRGISIGQVEQLEQRVVELLRSTEDEQDGSGARPGSGEGGRVADSGQAGSDGDQGDREKLDSGGSGRTGASPADGETPGGSQGASPADGETPGGSRLEDEEERIAGLKGQPDMGDTENRIEVERTAEGIKLSLPAIHFFPDEARILPSEKTRLDRLAAVLKELPEAEFLVKGHTADVGSRESQYVLSVDRAKTIIEELGRRGLAPERFIFQGMGGDEPVAPNDTEEGRERNRRVEVIILPSL